MIGRRDIEIWDLDGFEPLSGSRAEPWWGLELLAFLKPQSTRFEKYFCWAIFVKCVKPQCKDIWQKPGGVGKCSAEIKFSLT